MEFNLNFFLFRFVLFYRHQRNIGYRHRPETSRHWSMSTEKYSECHGRRSTVEYFCRHRQVQTKDNWGERNSARDFFLNQNHVWWCSSIDFFYLLNSVFRFPDSASVEAPTNVFADEAFTILKWNQYSNISMEAHWRKNMPSWCRSVMLSGISRSTILFSTNTLCRYFVNHGK